MNNCSFKYYQPFAPSNSFSLVYEKKKSCNVYKPSTLISQQNYISKKRNSVMKRNINENDKNNDIFINPNCEYIKSYLPKKKSCNNISNSNSKRKFVAATHAIIFTNILNNKY